MSVSRKCLCCVKYLMFVFNLIFWLGGCGLFGVGVWLSFTQAEFSSLPLSFPSLSAANLLLVAGGVTMVTGFLGCLGALKEQRCLLMTFFVILLLLVLTEVTLVLVIHIFKDKLDTKAQDELKEGMKIYTKDEGLMKSWDNVQKMVRMDGPPYQKTQKTPIHWDILNATDFKCCGVTNKMDWYKVLNETLPSSCCSVDTHQCVDGWSEGCYKKAREWLLDNIFSVLVFGVCIGIVQILALVFSLLMYCQILRAEKYLD
ncbi:Tetraspanin-9 [Merluccius polli]|uniref:Tetraspanin n=1 Tax=Merluccius polli TaxID=89951 RepID=A0AA47MPJ1_MERPO|nr:Tetraspanin-9 [Merluccius polli]